MVKKFTKQRGLAAKLLPSPETGILSLSRKLRSRLLQPETLAPACPCGGAGGETPSPFLFSFCSSPPQSILADILASLNQFELSPRRGLARR